MLSLDNSLWKTLEGGYRTKKYDASIKLKELEKATTEIERKEIYKEFWNELHHQGDVGLASYFALPHLIRIGKEKELSDVDILSLIIVIELARQEKNNPRIPKMYFDDYCIELKEVTKLVCLNQNHTWEKLYGKLALCAIATVNNQYEYAKLLLALPNEIDLSFANAISENYDLIKDWMLKKELLISEFNKNQLKLL